MKLAVSTICIQPSNFKKYGVNVSCMLMLLKGEIVLLPRLVRLQNVPVPHLITGGSVNITDRVRSNANAPIELD